MRGEITRRALLGQATAAAVLAQTPAAPSAPLPALTALDEPLRRLRASHPRLILVDSDVDRIRLASRETALGRRLLSDLEKECERLLSVPPVEYKVSGGRLQTQTRRAIDRITNLALLYRLSGRDSWLRRAVMELNAGSNFRDWNPARFVDTAEMTHAFAIGYDWLFNGLTEDERTWIREALLAKGIDPALQHYRQKSSWTRERYHWNVVANAAATMGVLAIAEDVPEKAIEILRAMYESAPYGLNTFGSDGSWPEGPYFGAYTTRYACLLMSSLDTALSGDIMPLGMRGIEKSGRFRAYTLSPSNRVFNYSDAPEEPSAAPEMFFLSRRYNMSGLAWSEARFLEKISRADPLHLAWFDREPKSVPANWGPDAVFSTAGVATFRTSWDDPAALFLGVKGGDNKSSHGHLDLGTFVFDAGGVRWASDPGADDYTVVNLPRNSFYRVKTESHNTLVVESESQDPRAEAKIGKVESMPDLSFVQIDLSHANPKLKRWTRRIGIANRQAVLMEDSVHSDLPVDILWGMMTEAEVTVTGPTATLHKNGWILAAEIRAPRHAVFDLAPVRVSPPQAQNPKLQRLVVRLLEKVTEMDLTITLTPYREGQPKPKITAQFAV